MKTTISLLLLTIFAVASYQISFNTNNNLFGLNVSAGLIKTASIVLGIVSLAFLYLHFVEKQGQPAVILMMLESAAATVIGWRYLFGGFHPNFWLWMLSGILTFCCLFVLISLACRKDDIREEYQQHRFPVH